MKSQAFAVLQKIGRSFMLPIALLPVAGLMLGIGASFTNQTTIEAYGLQSVLGYGTFLYAILTVMSNAGDIIFANLPILFAMGVAIGMANKEKEVAALAGAIGFFVMHATINSMLHINNLLVPGALPEGSIGMNVGIESLQMGVFGGIIVGLGVAFLHNKFYKIELPAVFSFFGGTRFVPIITALTYVLVGMLMFYIWPTVQGGILALGHLVNATGYFGTFLFGVIERALIPFGLHHVFYLPFWHTAVGGSMMIDGVLVEGGQNIFFAQLASPNTELFSVEATRYMTGKFPFMLFGLPGAALAMYHTAKPENKKVVSGLLLSAALTAVITGITEPLEFTFLFVAPVLFGIHIFFAGIAFALVHIFDIAIGQTFSGSLIDFILFGVLQGNARTNWVRLIIIGIPFFVIYYFTFKILILKFNFKTPGREDGGEEIKLYTKKDYQESKQENQVKQVKQGKNNDVSELIVDGLGGKDNIVSVDSCATRLRMTVKNSELVKDNILKQSGASGVIKSGTGVQVIYGPKVSVIKSKLEEYLDTI